MAERGNFFDGFLHAAVQPVDERVHDPARPHDAQIFFVRRKRGVVQNEGIDDGEVFVFETRVEDDAKRLFLRLQLHVP